MREGKLGLPGGLGRRERVLPVAVGGSWGRNTDFAMTLGKPGTFWKSRMRQSGHLQAAGIFVYKKFGKSRRKG